VSVWPAFWITPPGPTGVFTRTDSSGTFYVEGLVGGPERIVRVHGRTPEEMDAVVLANASVDLRSAPIEVRLRSPDVTPEIDPDPLVSAPWDDPRATRAPDDRPRVRLSPSR
jgi:hypothetical protein